MVSGYSWWGLRGYLGCQGLNLGHPDARQAPTITVLSLSLFPHSPTFILILFGGLPSSAQGLSLILHSDYPQWG